MRTRPLVLALVLVLVASEAQAAPPREDEGDRSRFVIQPGREASARELLTELVARTTAPHDWRGPTIDFDRIMWWLQRDGQPIGMLVAEPRERAEPGEFTSHSFVLRTRWQPEHTPSELEEQLMREACEAVLAGDHGQFYVYRFDLAFESAAQVEDPPYAARVEGDPHEIRLRWALELAGVGVLVLLALALTFRPRSER